MSNKIRGSQKGLIENRKSTKKKNTELLWVQVDLLRKKKPDSLWTYKEVWSGAGLKSNVALKSTWNSHILAIIDQHNNEIREEIDLGVVGYRQRKTLRASNKDLRSEISKLIIDRNEALSKIAIYQAEAEYYKNENKRLENRLNRIKAINNVDFN